MNDRADRTPGWESVPDGTSLHGDRVLPPAMTAAPTGPHRSGRRRLRRGAVVGIVAGATALVLLVVAGGVGWSVGSDSHSAERPVESFLDDLEHGHLSDAIRTAGIDRDRDDVLLTDTVYARAGDKVTAHRITSVEQQSDRATVRTVLTQAGRTVPATFELERTGTDWGVFPVWSLRAPTLGSVQVAVQGPPRSTVQVAGADVRTDASGTASLRAFPGSYGVHLDGGKWLTATDSTAAVPGFGATGTPVVVATTLTDAGSKAASAAVDAWVDACVAEPTPIPAGCSFYAYGADPANTYTDQKWTLESRPTVTVGGWAVKGWAVSTRSAGSASFRAQFTGPAGRGTATAGPITVRAAGWITAFSDDGATFESAIGKGQADSGS
ncbi:hypothetical protein [Curtobacterium herbarum]|uniref:hypothetical protein n=1 Tax=Curtobacterium herbarum TaxID=150122 RepID=UPI001958C8FE|nr:hypothetical protein [Curtobacterium herbarum]MBM7474033.1 hypothetical protein [Curtobacterium herbarum]MCS6544641.1 hypothetical protein [Curtobacterium herbarum]